MTTSWNAGAFPVQWIELDLGVTTSVSEIRLLINQSSSDSTTHQIYAGSVPNPPALVRQLSGATVNGAWLTATFSPALGGVRYVRVRTTYSQSWVSWSEIEVYGLNMNRIKARAVGSPGAQRGEFYDSVTNQAFVPRGNSYIRLSAAACDHGEPYHSTFDPGQWNPAAGRAALRQMKSDGYNLVRVVINQCRVAQSTSPPVLSTAYLTNVKEFLQIAKEEKIYVLIGFQFMPTGWEPAVCANVGGGLNPHYFCQSFIDKMKLYLGLFIDGIRNLGAPLDVVHSYEAPLEQYFNEDRPPINLTGVTVTLANGVPYTLPADRQQMMDASLVYWINQVNGAVKAKDPAGLFGVGFFSPRVMAAEPNFILRTYWAIADAAVGGSSADYVGVDVYPGFGYNVRLDLDALEVPASHTKPMLMAEFGAFEYNPGPPYGYPTSTDGAYAVRDLQVLSCDTKYDMSGWLLWTWDSAEQPGIWTALDDGGVINGILAPRNRPNACTP